MRMPAKLWGGAGALLAILHASCAPGGAIAAAAAAPPHGPPHAATQANASTNGGTDGSNDPGNGNGTDPIWPAHLNINAQLAEVNDAGCSGLCSWNGFVDGYVIGTAPVCEATCDTDCSGRACIDVIPGNVPGHEFIPDAGDLCLNEALTAAEIVFADRERHLNETLRDLYKQLQFTSGGKACCCATRLPRKDSYQKKAAPTPRGSTSCDDWCQYGGFGHGFVIGTAPACGASCANDCPGSVCSTANDFFSDYGNGCASGNKVCCCAQQAPPHSAMNDWKYSREVMDPPTHLPAPFSCAELCASGNFGSDGWVSGTAPFCGGSCADCGDAKCFHVEERDVTDYGNGCATGNKVCCCNAGAAGAEAGPGVEGAKKALV